MEVKEGIISDFRAKLKKKIQDKYTTPIPIEDCYPKKLRFMFNSLWPGLITDAGYKRLNKRSSIFNIWKDIIGAEILYAENGKYYIKPTKEEIIAKLKDLAMSVLTPLGKKVFEQFSDKIEYYIKVAQYCPKDRWSRLTASSVQELTIYLDGSCLIRIVPDSFMKIPRNYNP